MKVKFIFLLFIVVMLVSGGCSLSKCKKPYLQVGDECCLDGNDNSICDEDETCSDNIKDQDETDVDCGGTTCSLCEIGKVCLNMNDCISNLCVNNICVEESCQDNIKNQDETDVDCGGSKCSPCDVDKTCLRDSDCYLYMCENRVCSDFNALTEHYVTNSDDWKDVYSTIIFANLMAVPSSILTSSNAGLILPAEIESNKEILIISSERNQLISDYKNSFKYYNFVEEVELDNLNLVLARKANVKDYILVTDSQGYDAISVAPYAVKSKAFVLFVNKNNVETVHFFLNNSEVNSLMIYGDVDNTVRSKISNSFSSEIINKGNKFADNLEIVRRYSQIGSIKQVILTNGEFIEPSLMTGKEAIVFTGKLEVPDSSCFFLKNNVEQGVLIGNELINAATEIRRQCGINVYVKFASGTRVPGATINPIEDLDRFPVP